MLELRNFIGLAGQGIDPSTGQTSDAYVVCISCLRVDIRTDRLKTWGGGSDSYFEYLIKYPRLTNTNDNIFADTWATAVDSSIKTLLVVRKVNV
jgi:mannosyl-oligosaccharide alpha-1,2-mannosidase